MLTIGLKLFQFDRQLSNLIRTMFRINLILKKCIRKNSNWKSWIWTQKSHMSHAIPVKIIKQFCYSYLPTKSKIINERITGGNFQVNLNSLKWMQLLKIGLYEFQKSKSVQLSLKKSLRWEHESRTSFYGYLYGYFSGSELSFSKLSFLKVKNQ